MATIPNQTQGQTHSTDLQTAPPFTSRAPGLAFDRHFTRPGISPYDEIVWELRDAVIQDFKGKTIFEQKNVEVPADWSMTATNIVASKYLHGLNGTDERESGVRALITRVAESIRDWGIKGGYFATPHDAETFYAELAHLLLNQKVAFNSPVWFNVGCDRLEPNSDAQNWHWNPHSCAVEFSVTGYTQAAVLGLLHQLRSGLARFDPDARQDRGHALQVGIGRWLEPVATSAAPWRRFPAAAPPPARSASCAASMPSPASSSPAARPAARRRWSSSTSTIPISKTSSSAR